MCGFRWDIGILYRAWNEAPQIGSVAVFRKDVSTTGVPAPVPSGGLGFQLRYDRMTGYGSEVQIANTNKQTGETGKLH